MWEVCLPYHHAQVAACLLVTEVHAVEAAGCLQKQPEQSTSPPAFGIQHAVASGCMATAVAVTIKHVAMCRN